jgi:2'-5' RNA ligase
LFIAIPVPPEVSHKIGRVQGRLQRASAPGTVRWTPTDQFHITLKFLGDVPMGHLGGLRQALAPICAGFSTLELSARGLGFFPNASRPRVIWAGASDRLKQLPALHRQIDNALSWLAPTERPGMFTSHITLGRLKPGGHAGIPRLLEAAAVFYDSPFGDWQANEVRLVRSQLTAVRAEHTTIASFPLR